MVELYNILDKVAGIEVKTKMNLETLRSEQEKLKQIDKELRQVRKDSTYRITRDKCTELLHGISYAVSIYLPKERKIGISLINEAVGYLKVQAECLKFWKDPEEQCEHYKEQRNVLVEAVKTTEVERFRVNKELSQECPVKRHKELLSTLEEIECSLTSTFNSMYLLNNDFEASLKLARQEDLSFRSKFLFTSSFQVYSIPLEA